MLHGIGSNAASFDAVSRHLPASWRLLAWNAPGYEQSAPLQMDWPVAADYADALMSLVEALELPPFMLIGHSLGALIAAAFAVGYPYRVRRLVLAAPTLGHGVAPGGKLSPQAKERVDELEAMGPAAFAQARAARLVYAPQDNANIVAMVRDSMARVRMPGYGQASHMLASGELLDDVARLSVKTDVITGANDLVTPPDGARKAHAAIPEEHRGVMIEVPDVGHAITQQDPAAVAGLLAGEPVAA